MSLETLVSVSRAVRGRLLAPLRQVREARRERQFRALPTVSVDAGALGTMDATTLASLLGPEAVLAEWTEDHFLLDALQLPVMTGGVNPGDQRALHALMLGLQPKTVLEVGTHLGCSTVSLALAGRRFGTQIVTCDIADVNDETKRPWLRYGSQLSPKALVARVGCTGSVQFRVSDSLTFLREAGPTLDLIFLDGDHAAATVYRELPLALRALRPGGFVLLHDYFPDCRPLWDDHPPLRGPFLAVERLRAEGAGLEVLPLGALPWPTRSGSTVSSLALVVRPG